MARARFWGRTTSARRREPPLPPNGIDLLRLGLALLVVVAHAHTLGGFGPDPLVRATGGKDDLGTLAVQGFFCLSGYLITRSYLDLDAPLRYLWHRALRILPGFWVCLLVTVLVFGPLAALREGMPLTRYLADTRPDGPWHYLLADARLQMRQYGIAGLLSGVPYPGAFDGSLWTLLAEFRCYLAVGALGLVGVLRRGRLAVPLFALALMALVALSGPAPWVGWLPIVRIVYQRVLDGVPSIASQWACFMLGASAYLFRARLLLRWWLALPAGAVWALLPEWVQPVPLCYALLYASFGLPLANAARTLRARVGDFSYGVYIYAFPLQQLLALYGGLAWGLWAYLGLTLAALLPLSYASWRVIEARCLRLKDLQLPFSGPVWRWAWGQRTSPVPAPVLVRYGPDATSQQG